MAKKLKVTVGSNSFEVEGDDLTLEEVKDLFQAWVNAQSEDGGANAQALADAVAQLRGQSANLKSVVDQGTTPPPTP